MMYYTHVNRGQIDSNRKHGTNEPVVRYQKGKYGEAVYAHELELPAGSRIIYDHQGKILPCGARLVIASETEPKIIR